MEVEKLRNYISIVVIGVFSPDKITAEWVVEKGIVSAEAAQNKVTRRLERNLSVFMLTRSIEVVATRDRLQITGLIDDQDEVVGITLGILSLSEHGNIKGTGVNAVCEFTFKSISDGDRFGEFFVPMDKWNGIFKKPSVYELTLRDNADPMEVGYDKAINIKSITSVRSSSEGDIAAVRMSANFSFNVKAEDESCHIIKEATRFTDEFWAQFDQIIAGV
jgi:hypothetical protein